VKLHLGCNVSFEVSHFVDGDNGCVNRRDGIGRCNHALFHDVRIQLAHANADSVTLFTSREKDPSSSHGSKRTHLHGLVDGFAKHLHALDFLHKLARGYLDGLRCRKVQCVSE
jgi:hypothetical protein